MAADIEAVARKASELEAEAVLVGMPFTLKGRKGIQARQMEEFCRRLEEDGGCGCPPGTNGFRPLKRKADCAPPEESLRERKADPTRLRLR